MKKNFLKGSILVYTILVLVATLVLFILSDQAENFADTKKSEVLEVKRTELPSGTRYKTIEYGEKISVEEIFDITSKEIEGLEIETTNFDLTKIGTTNINVRFKKETDTTQGIIRLTIVDTVAPTITLKDSTIYKDQEFDPLADVSVKDNVDGDLNSKVNVSGIVDSSKEGLYRLDYTVSDSNNNQTTKTREITVIADQNSHTAISSQPFISEEPKKEESKSIESSEPTSNFEQSSQVNETVPKEPVASDNQPNVLIINGVTIPYQNGGQGSGQAIIDNNSNGSASTWGGMPIQSGDDGANTHFIGHNPGVFSVLFSVRIGQSITVSDSSGKMTNYTINNILHLDDFGQELATGVDYWDQTVGTTGGERITLQTCISDTENLMVFASK
ncbi:hypothetical protein A5819_001790 [Enterococcus sp. 7E2_DIV0204]|uniref:immunoglobulin-like domain-containing protein n=1 Tax=unclassified Enterococcus TaxID=2608891 RepID=UPI000A33DDA1|nr:MULTISPECIES: immunoglobulin-like domain-containing protein [unclassified Enterococcus]OTN89298.1 hypothetical protein A5819_001790 [Enterococcus sp. 7E2_DIV0204]OTP51744.1 hypothetical protein A5884_000939 [Enterococcus sp. 7D2_DIV0200]